MPTVAGSNSSRSAAGADRDAAAVGDAVEPGLMAGQAAHALDDVEGAALAHPMAEEIEPEPGIAQIDQMRAGVGQRDDPGLVLDQRLDPVVDGVEEAADKAGVEVLLEPEIEERVERVAVAARVTMSAIVRSASPAFSGLTGAATMTRSQLPWKTCPASGCADRRGSASRKLGSRNTAFSCSRS